MKTISTTIQIAALVACFAAQFHPASVTGMPGTRKAMQTLEVFSIQPVEQVVAQTVAFANPS
jgi:hypothetical protein